MRVLLREAGIGQWLGRCSVELWNSRDGFGVWWLRYPGDFSILAVLT